MYIILIVILVAVIFAIYLYNSLVSLRNKVKEAWADIETQLKRRYDLIPNLVETVKGYASHEKSTLEKVTELRTKAIQAQSLEEKAETENMLSETLKSLFAVAENYPDLKANQNFLNLQVTLKEIEEHLQLARRYYNGTVRDYNTKLEVFPNNLFAKQFKFDKSEFFQTKDEKEKEVVQVSFEQKVEPAQAPETTTTTETTPEAPATTPTPTPETAAPTSATETTASDSGSSDIAAQPTPTPEAKAAEPTQAATPTSEPAPAEPPKEEPKQ